MFLNLMAASYGKKPIIYGSDYLLDKVLTKEFTQGFSLWRPKYGIASQPPPPPWTLPQASSPKQRLGLFHAQKKTLAMLGHS